MGFVTFTAKTDKITRHRLIMTRHSSVKAYSRSRSYFPETAATNCQQSCFRADSESNCFGDLIECGLSKALRKCGRISSKFLQVTSSFLEAHWSNRLELYDSGHWSSDASDPRWITLLVIKCVTSPCIKLFDNQRIFLKKLFPLLSWIGQFIAQLTCRASIKIWFKFRFGQLINVIRNIQLQAISVETDSKNPLSKLSKYRSNRVINKYV